LKCTESTWLGKQVATQPLGHRRQNWVVVLVVVGCLLVVLGMVLVRVVVFVLGLVLVLVLVLV